MLNILFDSKMEGRVRTHHLTYDSSKIIRMWLLGKSAWEISMETGASLSTVYRWLRRYGRKGLLTYHLPFDSYLCNSVRHRNLVQRNNSRAQAMCLCGSACAVGFFSCKQSKHRIEPATRRNCSARQSIDRSSLDWWTKYFTKDIIGDNFLRRNCEKKSLYECTQTENIYI